MYPIRHDILKAVTLFVVTLSLFTLFLVLGKSAYAGPAAQATSGTPMTSTVTSTETSTVTSTETSAMTSTMTSSMTSAATATVPAGAIVQSDRPELQPSTGYRGPYGFGRDATQEEIDAWNIDVMPDGTGLPPGQGTASDGGQLFADHCSKCHGIDGMNDDYAVLVKPYDANAPWPQTPRTIGNYWPYATTLYDYINRAMPYDHPNSLAPDEVYALTAWLLYQNQIIGQDEVMNADSLPKVQMPAHDKFVQGDPRGTYRFR